MDTSSTRGSAFETAVDIIRANELKAFDDTKAGVKGLVDAGMVNIPKIFIRPPDELSEELNHTRTHLQVPVIDLLEIEKSDRRKEIVAEVQHASETWGFFQVVNHGIPLTVLNGVIDGVRLFHEEDLEVKSQLYTYDPMKKVRFNSNYDLFESRAANWRDTLTIDVIASDPLDASELPAACRSTTIEYVDHVLKLEDILFELLSEALGLKEDHLGAMGCTKGQTVCGHYYPACPEPELTLGISKHTDSSFLTILLQDQIGGLQILHVDEWVDIQPVAGGLVVNIGDLLQIISNDKFKSVVHRVLANGVGPRISIPFFCTGARDEANDYGPIKELISEKNPPLYRNFQVSDYIAKFFTKPLDGTPVRDLFRL